MNPPLSSRGALASLALCTLLASLGASSAHIALPSLIRDFNATFSQVQLVVLAFLFTVSILVVSVGRLGDMIGRRRLLLAGIALFTAASLVCAAAPMLWLLVAARAVQGIGAAIMLALGMAFVGLAIPREKAGAAMGLLGAMSAAGTALGPAAGGLLIDAFGWPAIFLVNVPLGGVVLLLSYRYLPKDACGANNHANRFDYAGTLLFAFSVAAYALAMTVRSGEFGRLNGALLLAALLGAILFIMAERVSPSPMISLSLFRDPVLAAGCVMNALIATVMMTTLVVGPFYLAHAFGLDATAVGLAMGLGPVAAAFAGIPAGRLVDCFGTRPIVLAGLVGLACATLGLSLMPTAYGVPGYLVCIVAMTVHFSLFQAANNTAVMSDVPPQQKGVVSGLLNLSRNLGFITGASLMGALYGSAAKVNAVAGIHAAFTVAAVLVGSALAIAIVMIAGFPQRVSMRRCTAPENADQCAPSSAKPMLPARKVGPTPPPHGSHPYRATPGNAAGDETA